MKKNISFIIVLCMLMALAPSAFADETIQEISVLVEGENSEQRQVSFSLTNIVQSMDLTLCAAEYTNGCMISISTMSLSIDEGINMAVVIHSPCIGDTLQLFLTDSNFRPVCDKIVILSEETGNTVNHTDSYAQTYFHSDSSLRCSYSAQYDMLTLSGFGNGADAYIVMVLNNDSEALTASDIVYMNQFINHDTLTVYIPLPNLETGTYYIKVLGNDGTVQNASLMLVSSLTAQMILSEINNARSMSELKDVLCNYSDILGIDDLSDNLLNDVIHRLCGHVYESIEAFRKDYDNAVQAAAQSHSNSSDGGGGSAPIIKINDIRTQPDTVIQLTVDIEENNGFSNLSLEVDYDEDVLTLVSVTPNDAVEANYVGAEALSVKPYILTWYSNFDTSFNGTLATLTFKVSDEADLGDYPITVSYYKGINNDNIDGEDINYNSDFESLDLQYADGTVTITHIPGDINADGRVNSLDAIIFMRYLAKWNVTVNEEALDTDANGRVNSKDITALLHYLAGWTEAGLH